MRGVPVVFAPRPAFSLPLPRGLRLELGARTLVMGILNVTPDSFAGGVTEPDRAADLALQLEADGADIIDIGGESTRPGADPVSAADEMARVLPVMERVQGRLRAPLSIDTYKAEVASAALSAGASIVNDISGLGYDPRLGDVVARAGAGLVLMHTRGRSREMYREAGYDNVIGEVSAELQQALERADRAGVPREQIMLDPGLGFAKRAEHSRTVLAELSALARLARPLLVGPSRKSFLVDGQAPLPPVDRDWGTAAAVTVSVMGGAHIVRVHNVAAMVQVVRAADALRGAARA
jgi:dihydropteroate synthase